MKVHLLVAALCAAGCTETDLDAIALPGAVLSQGLAAHWTFDEGAGAVAKDSSGHGYDGQLSGGTWISDARFRGGLRLVAGDYVTVSDFPSASPNWTVSVWLRVSKEQLAADSETWTEILSTENQRSGGWQMNIDRQLSQPRIVFSYWSPPLSDYIGTESDRLATGRWQNWVAVGDVTANRISLYLNGEFVNDDIRPSDILAGDSTLYFGRWNMAGRLLNGDLDDVAIWSRALKAAEIAALATESPLP